MSYKKQNFKDGQILTAEQLNRMEQYFQFCPQCYSEMGIGDILPETTLIGNDDNGDGVPETSSLTQTLDLVGGEAYTVIWNGTEYECTCVDISEMLGATALVLGNVSIMDMGEGNDEPFCIMYAPTAFGEMGLTAMITYTDGTAEPTINIKGHTEIVHTLDKKFLPDLSVPVIDLVELGMETLEISDDGSRVGIDNPARIEIDEMLRYFGGIYIKFKLTGTVTTHYSSSIDTETLDDEVLQFYMPVSYAQINPATNTVQSYYAHALFGKHIITLIVNSRISLSINKLSAIINA
ncbi:MAG: hypothetical protein IKY67_06315 [Paludibacteraceae bacterium]|nr:hypothetical protein [Paludibacteraceae bacterium]